MDLKAQKRDLAGKSPKSLKSEGSIPAELYGNKRENIHLAVNEKEFTKIYAEAGESAVITLNLENEKVPVLIYEVDVNPLDRRYRHIDFFAIKMDEKIITEVALEFIGESQAVKSGGVLVKSMQEIEVEALPGDLPSHIDVDLSALAETGSVIKVKDLKMPAKVKVLSDEDAVVATVVEVAKEEEVKPEISVADVKVEGEEKKKEGEEKADQK